ncbi:oligosaccharide flippase family protein [Photobacterium damselae]|uniref:oligosaccharide flippase family protein n=1 Tax=Photobacterium damselae TaxID=38293 RepID=UPI001EDDEA18|nr:oligosaccharide flippase family protein [Photobacterium damselae]MCG3825608.1 oligosaccharide flippase family protein [Photobacterium damselae]
MSKTHRLVSNTLSLLVIQFANYVAPFLIIPYLSRLLGIDGFGQVAMLLSMSGVLIVVIDYGFNISATPLVAKNRDNRDYINELLSSILCIKLLISFLLMVFIYFYGYSLLNIKIDNILLLSFTFLLIGQSLQSIWFFQGLERMKYITYVQVVLKIIYVIFVFLLVHNDSDINWVIFSLGLSNIIAGAISLALVYSNSYGLVVPSYKSVINEVKYSFSFFLSRVSVTVYSQASVFIIGSFSGAAQAGLYGGCEKLYQAAQSLMSPLSGALYPYLVKNKDSKLFYKLISITFCFLVIGCLGCIYLSDWILTLILGPEFIAASNVFMIFMLIVPISFLSVNFGYPAFALIDKVKIANVTVIIGSVLHIIGLAILAYLGMINALHVALILLVTEIMILSLRIGLFCKYRKLIKL